jgi:hypothetical protein
MKTFDETIPPPKKPPPPPPLMDTVSKNVLYYF